MKQKQTTTKTSFRQHFLLITQTFPLGMFYPAKFSQKNEEKSYCLSWLSPSLDRYLIPQSQATMPYVGCFKLESILIPAQCSSLPHATADVLVRSSVRSLKAQLEWHFQTKELQDFHFRNMNTTLACIIAQQAFSDPNTWPQWSQNTTRPVLFSVCST